MTYPEMLAERFRTQAKSIRTRPERLLLEELLDLQRAYMVALEIVLRESRDEDSTGR